MTFRNFIAECFVPAATSFAAPSADVKEIQILLKNRTEIRVELISVRDSSLVVCRIPGVSDDLLRSSPRLAIVLPLDSIDRIRMEGKSHVVTGLLLGTLGGGIAGGMIGALVKTELDRPNPTIVGALAYPLEKTANMASGAAIGGLAGLLVGGLIGGSASTPELALNPQSPGEKAVLREYSRYPREEPDFLNGTRVEVAP